MIRVRFAPSPTGLLHIGNARIAVFNWLFAKRHQGTFILRIEDTDVARSEKKYMTQLIEDLHWLGLTWQEGPDVGGQYGPYLQSERLHIYNDICHNFLKEGLAYPCYCTPEQLEERRQLARLSGKPPRYDNRCRNLTDTQKKAFESLRDSLKKVSAKAGSAVALNPQNGEIISLVNLPSYDNNSFVAGLTEQDRAQLFQNNDRPLLFRAISGIYPSGSTIKPLIAVAALNEGIITSKTTILSVGGIRIGSSFFPDWKAGGHGSTDVKKAIAESVNTFFYTVGGGYENFKGLGIERLDSYMTLFGLGEKLGIDLPGEASGLVPNPSWKRTVKKEKWYIGDTYHLSIGQGDLLTTPLQMASVTATIANGGTIYQPHLVKGYLDQRTNNIIEMRPKKESKKISIAASAFDTVRQGMRQTVLSGSGRALSNEPFEPAAKTGTAEAPSGNPHGWFIAFAPYSNPEIAVAVIVENGGEGYVSALPVARDILEEYFRLKNQPAN